MNTSSLLFLMIFILSAILVFKNNHSTDTIIFAQFQNDTSSLPLPGVNITSPHKGQQIPVNISDLKISGKSTDKSSDDDCQVSVIVNNVKPYQLATPSGTTGEDNNFSNWFFTLNSSYTSIKEGANKITAKLSCSPKVIGNNITKWYSINVTGIATAETNNSASIPPPQSSPSTNPGAQLQSKNSEPQGLDSGGDEVQEPPSTSEINDRIGEEIENLKDRILEQVEENLREEGIELNLR
jgi:hypothetical protein